MGIYDGVRILELGAGAAGPLATRYFAEQGARVIRVESRRRPDFLRALFARPGQTDALDASPMFVVLNPDKQSVALDLTRPEGVRIAKRLVAWADVLCESFAPGVMARFGLDWESLRAERPDLVMLSGCLFGQTGPQRDYPGFGGQGSAIAGFNHLTGWPDREPHGPWGTITDSLAPRYAALALAAALLERRRSGRGRHIDLSQIEAGIYSLSEWVVAASAGEPDPGRRGNRDERAAPHGVYPCRGEDRWLALAIWDDRDWRALCSVFGDPAWAREARFADADARRDHADELDAHIAEQTRAHEPFALAEALQAAGVDAGVVQDVDDLLADPQLAHREHFVTLEHAKLGALPFERCGFRLSASPGCVAAPGPDLGAHSEAVLVDLLGLSEQEYARRVEEGIVS